MKENTIHVVTEYGQDMSLGLIHIKDSSHCKSIKFT